MMNYESSDITQHFRKMSVPDNMKIVLFAMLIFLPVAVSAQQGYELDTWFWHRHLSTKDSLYTQDYDIDKYRTSIPIHLSQEDFIFLDSVATSVEFWTLPDTLIKPLDTVWVNGILEYRDEIVFPTPGKRSFKFITPNHRKSVEIISLPNDRYFSDKIRKIEDAILLVLERQPYYNTLPRPAMRY
jgi:hypothetical protein